VPSVEPTIPRESMSQEVSNKCTNMTSVEGNCSQGGNTSSSGIVQIVGESTQGAQNQSGV